MNILFLSDYFSTWNIGGATRVLASQIEVLKKHKREFEFLLVSGYPGDAEKENADFNWIRFPYKSNGFLSLLYYTIREVFRQQKIDIVHIHQPLIGYLACWALPNSTKKLYHFHSFWQDEKLVHAGSSLPKKMLSLFKGWIEKKALLKMDHFIVLSEFSKSRLLEAHPEAKISLIAGSVELNQFQTEKRVPSRGIKLLSVRRLEPRMGLDLLILAVSQLKREEVDVSLTIVGRGRERGYLEKLIHEHQLEKNVILKGRLTEEELHEEMSSHHGMVIPTKSLEGFGMSVVEAFAAGLPVLATKVGALSEFEKHEGAFYTIESPDVEAMVQGIKNVMEPWREVVLRTKTCRHVAETYYSHEIMGVRLTELYRKLV